MKASGEYANVRYLVDDVQACLDFYTAHLGFVPGDNQFPPAFADVRRGNLRLLLSGPRSSAGRRMPDGRKPEPGGWNRIQLEVEDVAKDVDALRSAGVRFRSDIITGFGADSYRLALSAAVRRLGA